MGDMSIEDDDHEQIEFAPNVPLSVIIEEEYGILPYEDEFLASAKVKAHKLFNKYIKYGSEFQINISSMDRNKIVAMLGDLEGVLSGTADLNELYAVFEVCRTEMDKLLQYSLTRFRFKEIFEGCPIVLGMKTKSNVNSKS